MAFAKDLRASVLQTAMQGKLVEQRAEEGTAEELFVQIQKEKQKLIAEKKVKKEKPLPEITEDEKPFDIPESWKWIRFGDTGILKSGYAFKSSEYSDKGIQVVRISDLGEDIIDTKDAVYYEQNIALNQYLIKTGSFLICMTGSIGKMAWVKDDINRYLNQRVGMFEPFKICYPNYLWYFLHSYYVLNQWISAKTSTNGNIKNSDITGLFLPLPPLAEQKRIVRRIEEIMIRIDELEAIEEELKKLKEAFPGDMKNAILQATMQGKLTEQLDTDSSIDELLENIKKEREKLVKEGKIKKSKTTQNDNFVEFSGDEIPFEVPDNWRWIKLKNISQVITKGTTPKGGDNSYVLQGIKFLRAENVLGYDVLDIENTKYITEKTHKNELTRSVLEEDDILVTIAGTLGRTAIVKKEQLPLNTNQAIAFVRLLPNCNFNLMYIIYAINSPIIKQLLLKQKKITAIPNLSLENISNLTIPIPPLEEQNRIVAKLAQILPLIADLS